MKTMMNETPNEIINTYSRRNNKMKKFTKILKNQKGLTLIELLAVIVILAIVAAIAVPSIGNIINNSKDKAILSEASNILSGAKLATAEGACDPTLTSSTCNNTILNGKYVEGISDVGGTSTTYSVSQDATTKVWKVSYSKFSLIKDSTNKTAATASGGITESSLNELLEK